MGPCLFRHGNLNRQDVIWWWSRLQWGRAFSGTEIRQIIKDMVQRLGRFNGAVPFQARKYRRD